MNLTPYRAQYLGMLRSVALLLALAGTSIGQQAARPTWAITLPEEPAFIKVDTAAGALVIAGTATQLLAYDGADGKPLWQVPMPVKEDVLAGVYAYWDMGQLIVEEQVNKKKTFFAIDTKTGRTLWKADKLAAVYGIWQALPAEQAYLAKDGSKALHLVDAATGTPRWTNTDSPGLGPSIYLPTEHAMAILTAKDYIEPMGLAYVPHRLAKYDLATGRMLWGKDYVGNVIVRADGQPAKGSVRLQAGRLVAGLYGAQIFDLDSGTRLFSNPSRLVPYARPRPLNAPTYSTFGHMALPLPAGANLYAPTVDGEYNLAHLDKVQAQTGKLLWSTPNLEDMRMLPYISLAGPAVVIQTGGQFMMYSVRQTSYTAPERKRLNMNGRTTNANEEEYDTRGPRQLLAYDTATGKLLWQEKTLCKKIIGSAGAANVVMALCENAVVLLDAATGSMQKTIPLEAAHIGDPRSLVAYGPNAAAIGTKGVAIYEIATGKLLTPGQDQPTKTLNAWDQPTQGNTIPVQAKSGAISFYNIEKGTQATLPAKPEADAYLIHGNQAAIVLDGTKLQRVGF